MSNYALVVDDNPSDLLMSTVMVEQQGFVVIQAKDGFEAIDKLEDHPYKILLVDLQMPKMSGIELIKRIRAKESFRKTPVLVTSARKESKDVKGAIGVGASDYLVKPIDAQVFEEKFNRLVGKVEQWKEYKIDLAKDESKGHFNVPIIIESLSEVSLTIISQQEKNLGENLVVGGTLFAQKDLSSLQCRVQESEKHTDGYRIKLSFLGLDEQTRGKIRSLCMEIWNQSNKE